jgi:hypothetical protein
MWTECEVENCFVVNSTQESIHNSLESICGISLHFICEKSSNIQLRVGLFLFFYINSHWCNKFSSFALWLHLIKWGDEFMSVYQWLRVEQSTRNSRSRSEEMKTSGGGETHSKARQSPQRKGKTEISSCVAQPFDASKCFRNKKRFHAPMIWKISRVRSLNDAINFQNLKPD